MAAAARKSMPVEAFGEKTFYLEEFRAHTLCFAVALEDCERPGGFEMLGRVAGELIANDIRVIILLGTSAGPPEAATRLQRIRRRLQRFLLNEETGRHFPGGGARRRARDCFVDLTAAVVKNGPEELLQTVWQLLRKQPVMIAIVGADELLACAQFLAGRLRVHKLVIVEPAGGVSSATAGSFSFMDDAILTAVLRAGQAEWAGLAGRRVTLEAIQSALRQGVKAVNLCALDGLARELYTYEGSGTLFTLEDYCRIERLGIDDFGEIERLIARGQREGYLKPRSPAETARIMLNGFGATIGTNHFAGVCGLETEQYAPDRIGEIVGLYTITRFKGEGVGGRLVARVLEEARTLRLRYVFACTSERRAQAFFEREGFRTVGPEDVPAAKWKDYDKGRLARLKIYRREVEARGQGR
jgi:amino-acid N-acetyltransferase